MTRKNNNNNHNTMNNSRQNKNSSSHMAMTSGGAVQRIRTPSSTDILLGRGGSINSHVGNQVFREWVKARREEYNLAPNKVQKTLIARKVMDMVYNSGGRFLQRDTTTSAPWWVEVDDVRALAKTSQALREGAPQIRAAHQQDGEPKPRERKRGRGAIQKQQAFLEMPPVVVPYTTTTDATSFKRIRVETPPPSKIDMLPAVVVDELSPNPCRSAIEELREGFKRAQHTKQVGEYRPLMSNAEFQSSQQQHNPQDDYYTSCGHHETHHHGHEQEVYLEEIPNLLTSIPHMPHELPPSHLIKQRQSPPPFPPGQAMQRYNSLALSDISGSWTNNGDWGNSSGALSALDFVNPFLEEELSSAGDHDPSNLCEHEDEPALKESRTPTPVVCNISSDKVRDNDESYHEQLNSMYGFSSPDYDNNNNNGNNKDHDHHEYALLAEEERNQVDFNEELMHIFDQVSTGGKEMPTLLLPFRGGALQRRYGNTSGYSSNGNSNSQLGNAFGTVSNHRPVSPHQ
jgi:hypothetical protein